MPDGQKFQGYDRLGKRIEQLAQRQSNLCVLSRCGVKFCLFFFFFFFFFEKERGGKSKIVG